MHFAYAELGELEEEMHRSFHGHFKKDINVESEIGVILPPSFDGREGKDLTFKEQILGPPFPSSFFVARSIKKDEMKRALLVYWPAPSID
jgi:hypothetical protein